MTPERELKLPQSLEVVEDGKRVIRPDVLSFLYQATAAAQLVKLRKLEESKGGTRVVPLPTFTVTAVVTELRIWPPWISLSGINDGPGALFWAVNERNQVEVSTPVNANEAFTVDMLYPVIKWLYFRAAPGTTASVRLFGKEGKA